MIKLAIIPLLAVLLIGSTTLNATSQKTYTLVTGPTDSEAATRTVLDFLRWYKAHISATSKIILVNQQAGKAYSVNKKNAEQYLTYLKSSHMLTDTYLNEWRTYFNERQAGFQLSPQHEGPPTGFEYDLVMLSQDVDEQLNSLKSLKINSVKVRQNRASVKFFLLEDYEFRLIRQNNRWLINEILNLSAE